MRTVRGFARLLCQTAYLVLSVACGGETPLHDLTSAHIRCKCGKIFKYRTNIEEDSITYNCLSCGAPVDLVYNKKARAYQTVR